MVFSLLINNILFCFQVKLFYQIGFTWYVISLRNYALSFVTIIENKAVWCIDTQDTEVYNCMYNAFKVSDAALNLPAQHM